MLLTWLLFLSAAHSLSGMSNCCCCPRAGSVKSHSCTGTCERQKVKKKITCMRDESGEEEASAEEDDERKDPFRVPPPPPIFHTFESERDGNGHQLGCQVEEEMNDRFAPPPPPTFPRIPTCNVLAEKMPFSPSFKTFSHARTLSSVYVRTVFFSLDQPRQWLQKRSLGGFEKFNACSIFFPWKIMLSLWACENEMTRYRQDCFPMDVHGCLTLY